MGGDVGGAVRSVVVVVVVAAAVVVVVDIRPSTTIFSHSY